MEILRYGSRGPLVEFLQSVLKKLGFYTKEIEGQFGSDMRIAVQQFQREFGLQGDGVVGERTWRKLAPYLKGYREHKIKAGDSLYKIARRYNAGLSAVQSANPGLDPQNLQIGDIVVIPLGSVVPTDISYSSQILQMNLESLIKIYPFLDVAVLGMSVMGTEIPVIRIGSGPREVFYSAAIHANEWIVAVLLMKFLEDYCKALFDDEEIFGYRAREMYEQTSIYLVPMANPDGVDLVTGQIRPGTPGYFSAVEISRHYPAIPFPEGWKANIVGTDLNLQFPAGWEQAREIKSAQGYTRPAPRDYVGPTVLSAPEALALYQFTRRHDFRLILAYHTQGSVIYWRYLDYLPQDSAEIGFRFSEASGYVLESTPLSSGYAGYKDWFIQDFNRPGFTIEAGLGENPLPITDFEQIYEENLGILVLGAVL